LNQLEISESTNKENELLDAAFLQKIEKLSLISKRLFSGQMKGERRSTKRGSSVEFADYRDYSMGDDFRRVDWNVYARLEKLFLKLFVEEEDLHVYILIDCSKSMGFGNPSKLLYAKRLAAALSYIGLCNFDRVGLAALAGNKCSVHPPKRGKQSAFEMFDYLSSLKADNETKLGSSLHDFSLRTRQPGLVILISDFFDESYQTGINALVSRKFDVVLFHLLSREEENPSIVGDLLLIDSETSVRREITITQTLLRKYQQRLAGFCKDIETYSLRYGCSYIHLTSESPFENLILNYLRRRGALR